MPARRNALSARSRAALLALAVLLALACSVGVTYAYLQAAAEPVTASFTPGSTACSVVQNADDSYTVYNSGNTPVYVRVSAAYAPKADGTGSSSISAACLPTINVSAADGWALGSDGCWYYVNPVQPGASTAALYVTVTPTGEGAVSSASAAVMAECVQSAPAAAVNAAWGNYVTVGDNGTLSVLN